MPCYSNCYSNPIVVAGPDDGMTTEKLADYGNENVLEFFCPSKLQ